MATLFFIFPGGLFAMFGERFSLKGKPVGTPPEGVCVNGHCVLFRTCEDDFTQLFVSSRKGH